MYQALSSDLVVVRQPLLPVNAYLSAQAQVTNGQSLESILRSVYIAPPCQEAIFYASPALHKQLIDWLAGQPVSSEFLLTLYKYFVRLTTRATPFGLFAGVGVTRWDDSPELAPKTPRSQAVIRLSTDYLCHIIDLLVHIPLIRNQLIYRPNNTLCQSGQSYRYIGFSEDDCQLTYYQQELPASHILEQLLQFAYNGATVHQLCGYVEQNNITPTDASDYISALIDNQVFISELGISLTGDDAFDRLINYLSGLKDCQFFTECLRQIQLLLQTGKINTFAQIDELLAPLNPTMAVTVQCDAGLPIKPPELPVSVRNQLNRLLPTLLRLHQAVDTTALSTFRTRFYERFGEQSVPLLLALDPNSGIGYGDIQSFPAPWLSGQTWTEATSQTAQTTPASLPQKELLSRYVAALQQTNPTIRLTTYELSQSLSAPSEKSLPYHAYVFLSLINPTESNEQIMVLKGMGGPSAINLLGRFAHLDPALDRQLHNLANREQAAYPDYLLTELIHLPENRTGNMLRRSQFRPYEIPILTTSTALPSQQFPLNELFVSVPYGQNIVLHSVKSDKPILPRLSTAHKVHAGHLSHYRFLYDLQYQHENLRVNWHWGALAHMPFLPRVQIESLILARAQWNVPAADLASATLWSAWRQVYRVGRFVRLGEGDNELTIDTEFPYTLPILQQASRRSGYVTLIEALLPTELSDTTHWCHEIIVPIEARTWVRQPIKSTLAKTQPSKLQRRFLPGSPWIYLKIYAGPSILDTLLINEIDSIIRDLFAQLLVDKWFFIRYADPETHLRIRVHSQPDDVNKVIMLLNRWISLYVQPDDRIYRIQFDTYERELERYGHKTIERGEAWFGIESNLVLQLLKLANDDPSDIYRLRIGCLMVYQLLVAWKLSLQEQINVTKVWRDKFLSEFEGGKRLRDELNAQFRQYKTLLNPPDPLNELPLSEILNTYQREAQQFFEDHLTLVDIADTNAVLDTISHLLLNRLFADDQRRHELIVYAYLYKLLKQWQYIAPK